MRILMVAAENGAFPGAKVGGIGDVIRDLPVHLARAGHKVTVMTPGYQSLSRLPSAQLQTTLTVDFCSSLESAALYRIIPPQPHPGVEHWVVENSLFAACGEGRIYCDDPWRPFALDANKFAFFCNAVCYALATGAMEKPDVVHLHDWHTTLFLWLRKTIPAFKNIMDIPTVYTIHNLSLQGVRPFAGDSSSLESWFPGHAYSKTEIVDPFATDCINLMRTGINLADRIHVVSPTYAREILQPSIPDQGVIRGEGLEADLQLADRQRKIAGILNGCEYPEGENKALSAARFFSLAGQTLQNWAAGETHITTNFFFARERLMSWAGRDVKPFVLASVGRLSAQKVRLLEEDLEPGSPALEALLKHLGKGLYIMLGSGDSHYEQFMTRMMVRHENFIFLRGYSDELADALYRFCDLFLMPSSFEPCGISQMLAMRAAKPCLVHHVGGLADTVQDGINGFSFSGDNLQEQVTRMEDAFKRVLKMKTGSPAKWRKICRAAGETRFYWDDIIKAYETKLYIQP